MLGAAPAFSSADMRDLLGANNFHYFSVAIGQVMVRRYFHWYVGCSLVALIHLTGEWLYLGKYPRRGWLALIACLWLVGIAQSAWLQPRLAQWHLLQYERPAQREAYGRAFRVWHGVSLGLNCLAVLGLAVYLWRVANPPDTMHFVGASSKFRS